jgi:membrane protein implicated in regulation of membrane protease activity
MARFLIFTGLILLVAGLLWPYVAKLGLGHLPGDIVFKRGNTTFYFPIVTSIVLSAVLWLLGRRAKRQTNKR